MVEPTTPSAAVSVPERQTLPPDHRDDEERSAAKLVEADLLVEDVSIDGMCGVY